MTDQAKTTRQMTIDATLGNAERSSKQHSKTNKLALAPAHPTPFITHLSASPTNTKHISQPPFHPSTLPPSQHQPLAKSQSRQITVSPIKIHAHPQLHTSHGQQALIPSTPDYAYATSTITTHKTRPQDKNSCNLHSS